MVRPKAPRKKQQQRGVDFKKIKRKIGRKLPPPKNATNTEIKSKESAMLWIMSSHYPSRAECNIRKGGFGSEQKRFDIERASSANISSQFQSPKRDIFLKYPTELRLHKLAVIEKLRERISDDDKLVRETLYQLLKSVIFPTCKEDNQGPFISLMMAYIFNAMTHLAIDVRLMAFKFFDLVVQYYPSSFSLYSEKIFQNYEDVLRKNQFYLQDKGKLKNVLAGLVHCLLLLPSSKADHDSPCEKDDAAQGILHAFEPDTPKHAAGFSSIDLVVRFFAYGIDNSQHELQVYMLPYEGLDATIRGQTIMPSSLKKLFDLFPLNPSPFRKADDDKYFAICSGTQSGKAFHEKHILSLIPFIPKLVFQVVGFWKSRILQAFTETFKSCNLESSLKWACLSAIEEMLVPRQGLKQLDASDPELLDYQITWMRELPLLLIMLDDKHPLRSRSVLSLLLRLGQCAVANTFFAQEYDNMQDSLAEFYCNCMGEKKSCPMLENDEISNCGISKSITRAVCSCLLQMGDYCLLFQILEKVVLDQITPNPALDNLCALLRMLVALDARPTRFSQQSIIILSNFLPGYLIDVVSAICFPEDDDESRIPVLRSTRHYYFLPCYILFYRSNKLLNLVLRKMGSLVTEKSRITAIVSVVLLMHKDVKVWKILSSCKTDIDFILQSILVVQFPPSAKFHSLAKAVVPEHSSEEDNMVLEERHKIQSAVDRLNTLISES
ncbi:unnamed protein product [Camellia sinensis]